MSKPPTPDFLLSSRYFKRSGQVTDGGVTKPFFSRQLHDPTKTHAFSTTGDKLRVSRIYEDAKAFKTGRFN